LRRRVIVAGRTDIDEDRDEADAPELDADSVTDWLPPAAPKTKWGPLLAEPASFLPTAEPLISCRPAASPPAGQTSPIVLKKSVG